MPKVPNRRHSHHLNEEDERRSFVQAVADLSLISSITGQWSYNYQIIQ
jgi:hypothetical protein